MYSQFLRETYSGFSSALLVLAGLTPKSFKLTLVDENFEDIDFEQKYDLVAISTMTQQAWRAYEIADTFRRRGIKVVIGGIHATSLPGEAKEHADSVVIGEAEEIWKEVLKDAENNTLKPYYKNEKIIDLTKSPMPRYDLLKKEYYKIVWIQTTRGCPIDCEFCAASKVFGLKLRHKTIKQVIKEIKFVLSLKKNFRIGFADDNMLLDRKYATSLVKALKSLNIRWIAQTDISIAEDESFLKLLRNSGCAMLLIGFESLTEANFRAFDRNSFKLKRLKNYHFYINKIQSFGIGIVGAFILGFDNDDTSIFDRTAKFIIKSHIFASQITVLTPLPGTRLRDRIEKENRLLDRNWNHYTFYDVNFVPKKMSFQQLQKGLLKVHKDVYDKKVLAGQVKYFKEIYNKI